jgi:hypothetical protein
MVVDCVYPDKRKELCCVCVLLQDSLVFDGFFLNLFSYSFIKHSLGPIVDSLLDCLYFA